ncbi:LysR family transcriptional regulator [Neorhizobium sp. P12A]|uniref:LysR family transcriptional regulator n=1 Tax=Rhizobium/Agrobacterium group TaxID=227290 RepID=UPI00104812CB|nr:MULTISPECIES: LysR family transcriptional regulator [Rhizobium/Agrobacterium group]KAA0695459.1 LysR family transcriptional regulator [Neorhizobium sp. P12A]TCR79004.1 DNA-binding transcriptional LysR family regulator [Rhizobium sp. BK376]
MRKSGLIELDAVVTVARKGGFRAAATELGMSPTALSHAVAALESRLGVRLFNRTTRSVSLSEAGEQFIARVAPALSEIRDAMEGVNTHRDTPAGTLRLNTTVGAAHQILVPVVLEYMKRYPDMRVDIVTDAQLIDIVMEGFDAGIRTIDAVPGDMIGVPFGPPLRFVVVASPAYLAARPAPRTPGDLLTHRCIRARWPSGTIYRWEFERRAEKMTIDVPGELTLDDSTLMRDAALAGAGLAYMWEAAVAADTDAGRLVRVLDDWTTSSPGFCLYYPGRRNVPAGLRAFINLIREVDHARAAD